jgi:hypothetical protein
MLLLDITLSNIRICQINVINKVYYDTYFIQLNTNTIQKKPGAGSKRWR